MPPVARRAKQARCGFRIVGRILAVLGVTLLAIMLLTVGTVYLICRGPSPAARDLFTTTLIQSEHFAFIPSLFLSNEQIATIVENNTTIEPDAATVVKAFEERHADIPLETIELIDVEGSLYTGKLMIVHDPARLSLVTLPFFDENGKGCTVANFAAQENAVAAVSGGTTLFPGIPNGMVIKNGALLCGTADTTTSVVALDETGHLLVGRLSAERLLSGGAYDAVSSGPALIVNGTAATITGSGSGLGARTVIGQRPDGALLLLVIEGETLNSLGATYKDCAQLMLQYGAENAAVLSNDHAAMTYNGGPVSGDNAAVPTAFIVQ